MKYAHPDVLDQGPNLIKTACTRMLLISNFTAGDSYATVIGNKLAEVVMTSADFTLGNSGSNRILTVTAGKTAGLTVAAAGTDLHIAFTDGTSRVLLVTDETGNGSASIGATATFPGPVYTSNQPV